MTELSLVLAIILFLAMVLSPLWIDHMEEKRKRVQAEKKSKSEPKPEPARKTEPAAQKESRTPNLPARDLFLDTLTRMGCQYKIEEDEAKSISFRYQGEHFLVDADNERAYVRIWDLFWEGVDLPDIDNLSRMRKAINEANFRTKVNTVFVINPEDRKMYVHSKSIVPFFAEIPEIDKYLESELVQFFKAHDVVRMEMQLEREREGRRQCEVEKQQG